LKNASGIYIAVNYNGGVYIICNASCGPSSRFIFEEFKQTDKLKSFAIQAGMWSKPASCRDNLQFSAGDSSKVIPIYQLALRIPGHINIMQQPASDQGKQMDDLGRICWTERPAFAWSNSSQFYYPIGNSVGFNILGSYGEEKGDVKILLGACGDIRNLLATVYGAPDTTNSIAVTMNDENVTMLARNLVLLYLCANSSPDVVLAVWETTF
jgi:hypothetical protein